jgi:hypothetical protein
MKKLTLLSIFLLITIQISAVKLLAGFAVTPTRQEVILCPGQKFSGKYSLTNNESYPVKVKISYQDWSTLEENKYLNIKDWLKFSNSEEFLNPSETKEITYEINPSSEAKGSHVWLVSFSPEKVEGSAGLSMVISGTLFVTFAGTEQYDWKISDKTTTLNKKNLSLSMEIANDGNVSVRPRGKVLVLTRHSSISQSLFGKKSQEIDSFSINEGFPVYPRSKRSLSLIKDRPINLKPGKYTLKIILAYAEQEKTATLNIRVKKNGELTIEDK